MRRTARVTRARRDGLEHDALVADVPTASVFRPKIGWVIGTWLVFAGNVAAFTAEPSVGLGVLLAILAVCTAEALRARVVVAADRLCQRALGRKRCVALRAVRSVKDAREVTGAFLAPVPRVLIIEDNLGNRVRVERHWWSRSGELFATVRALLAENERPTTQ